MFQGNLGTSLYSFGFFILVIGLAWNRWRGEPVRISAVTLARLNRHV